MITMAVLVVTLLGFMGANTAVQQSSAAAFERAVAVQDANQVIERMRNTAAAGTFPANVTGLFPNGGAVNGFNTLTSELIIVTYVNPAANPLDATVTVRWLEKGVRNVDTSLRTLITQRL